MHIDRIRYYSTLIMSMTRHRRSRYLRLDQRPVVSFTFDDAPASAKIGADILRRAGYSGTFYISAGLLGTIGPQGRIVDGEMLRELASEGHEIGCHTHSHLRASDNRPSTYYSDIDYNRKFLQNNYSISPTSFAFPFGSITPGTKSVAASFYLSCRTTIPGMHRGQFDASFLRANRLYGEQFTEAHAQLITTCAQASGWLIFYTHDVQEHPSQWGCSPKVLKSAIEKTLSVGCDIRTVGAMISDLD